MLEPYNGHHYFLLPERDCTIGKSVQLLPLAMLVAGHCCSLACAAQAAEVAKSNSSLNSLDRCTMSRLCIQVTAMQSSAIILLWLCAHISVWCQSLCLTLLVGAATVAAAIVLALRVVCNRRCLARQAAVE